MARFQSAYLNLDVPCRWLRGNHHGHSTVSDGKHEPREEVAAYGAAGYDYLALSEHDTFLDPADLQPHTSMCLLPAVEVTSCHGQTLMFLGADRALPAKELEPREIMKQVHESGGLFVFNHSNWKPVPNYATDELLDSLEGLTAMEIYCGVIERLPGEANATNRWDRLLTRGWRVFGHGTDDQHEKDDRFIAWNSVQWPERERPTAAGIIAALSAGRFCASTGVNVMRTGVGGGEDGQAATVESDADVVHWIGPGGVIFKKTNAGNSSVSVSEVISAFDSGDPERPLYVRAECLGRGNATAWTQPFRVAD